MEKQSLKTRLSRISTQWSALLQAHADDEDDAQSAQRLLLERYGGAVHRYLLAIVRDADIADELGQDFAVRFLRGDFRSANPERGRFRDFLKTSLRRLVIDRHRRLQQQPRPVSIEGAEPAGADEFLAELDRQFIDSWRNELLARAWEQLGFFELSSGSPFHTVLRLRTEHPDLRSADLAERLSDILERSMTPAATRQLLHRAREKFAELLLAEVSESLAGGARDDLDDELLELGLLEYCRPSPRSGSTATDR